MCAVLSCISILEIRVPAFTRDVIVSYPRPISACGCPEAVNFRIRPKIDIVLEVTLKVARCFGHQLRPRPIGPDKNGFELWFGGRGGDSQYKYPDRGKKAVHPLSSPRARSRQIPSGRANCPCAPIAKSRAVYTFWERSEKITPTSLPIETSFSALLLRCRWHRTESSHQFLVKGSSGGEQALLESRSIEIADVFR